MSQKSSVTKRSLAKKELTKKNSVTKKFCKQKIKKTFAAVGISVTVALSQATNLVRNNMTK